MAYQFIHLEAYGRKSDSKGRSVAWILDEASREPGASPHVPNPAAPEVIHGASLNEVRRRHDEACSNAKATLANGRTRAISRDQKTLLTVVASHPSSMDSVRSDVAVASDVAAWEKRTVDWLRDQYGDGLVSVVRHIDESFPHIHAYVLPADLRALALHPGTAAKRAITSAGAAEGEDAKMLNRRGDQAYKSAMRAWQDSYHEQVGIPCGLARLGPGRRRLSREEWQAEKSAAKATKTALSRAARIDAQGRAFVAAAKSAAATSISAAWEKASAAERQAEAAKVLHDAAVNKEREASIALDRAGRQATEAKALQAAAVAREQEAAATLDRADRHAEQIVARALSKASRISSWGSRLRTFVDGLRKSSIAAAARLDAAREIARERARADDVQRRLLEETSRRHEADRRARTSAESAQVTARERDQARQELAALRPAAPTLDVGRRMGR